MKTLVVYYYNENNTAINNLAFFLKHGIINNDDYQYVFIMNKSKCSINIIETERIKVIKQSADNSDLVSYSLFFSQNPISYFTEFQRFYFINSCCLGPFLPILTNSTWIELFNKRLETCDLIAPIVEFPPDTKGYSLLGIEEQLNIPFLHAYMFGTNISSIKLLINIFSEFTNNSEESLIHYERILSTKYILNNKKIACLLLAFKDINLNDKNLWNYKLWNRGEKTCYELSENYFGLDLNPLEIIFVKNIPKIDLYHTNNISKNLRSQLMNYSIWY